MYKYFIACFYLFVVLIIQGCAIGIRNSDALPPVNRLELRSTQKTNLKVWLNLKEGTKKYANSEIVDKTRTDLVSMLNETNLATVTDNSVDADVFIDANLFFDPPGLSALVTVFSLGVVPTWGSSDFRLEAIVQRNGKKYPYSFSDSYRNITWWPLIVAAPFFDSIERKDVVNNLYATLIKKMIDDDVFK